MNKGSDMRHSVTSVFATLGLMFVSTVLRAQEVSPDMLAIAAKVHTGRLVCENRQTIMLWPDTALPGRFTLKINKTIHYMTPVATTSGAVRLEDNKSGAVWIQTLEKSMLMDSRLSKRVADECQSPAQKTAAQQIPASARTDLLEANSNDR
jgi:hypothetical protein